MNLLKLVSQRLDERTLGLLGAALGEHEVRIRDGVEATVPAIVTCMKHLAQTEHGREMLWRELRDTDDNLAFDFEKNLRFRGSDQVIDQGSSQLRGLVDSKAEALIMSVSRASDLGGTSSRKLVGAVTPLVFACVAKHQRDVGLSPEGLRDLLDGQAQYCDMMLPKGLESGLASSAPRGISTDIHDSANSPAAASGTGYGFAPRAIEQTSTDQKFAEFSQSNKTGKEFVTSDSANSGSVSREPVKPIYESDASSTGGPAVTKISTSGQVDHERMNRIENGIKKRNAYENSNQSATARARSASSSVESPSSGLSWLWWPVLIAASLAALIYMGKKMDTTPEIAELPNPPLFDEPVQTPAVLAAEIADEEPAKTLTSAGPETTSDSKISTPEPDDSVESNDEAAENKDAEVGIPADDQVESLIEKLSTVVDSITDEDSAKESKSDLADIAKSLKEVLAERADWKPETVELVDLQLGDDASKLVDNLNSLSDDKSIAKVLKKELKQLKKFFDVE